MAHEDLNRLLNELLPFAKQMLDKHDEFYPFGGYVDAGGGIGHIGAWTGSEHPPSQEVLDASVRGLRAMAERGEIRASAIVVDVLTVPPGESEKRDAISVRLEHENGEAVVVFVPY